MRVCSALIFQSTALSIRCKIQFFLDSELSGEQNYALPAAVVILNIDNYII